MVMVLAPIISATLAIDQFDPLTTAEPEVPVDEDHVTATAPLAPATVPLSEIVLAVVVAEGTLTVIVNGVVGVGAGVGAGAGVEGVPSCAAYSVRIAVLSPEAKPVTIL